MVYGNEAGDVMKRLIGPLIALFALIGFSQTRLSTPTDILPNAKKTVAGLLRVQDKAGKEFSALADSSLTHTVDDTLTIGTAAKRISVLEGKNVISRTAASSNQRCALIGSLLNCFNTGNTQVVFIDPGSSVAIFTAIATSATSNAIVGTTNAAGGAGGVFSNASGAAGAVALQASSSSGPAMQILGGGVYPDIASTTPSLGIFLNKTGAPSGGCSNGSLWLRNNGVVGTNGYYCIATVWVAVF